MLFCALVLFILIFSISQQLTDKKSTGSIEFSQIINALGLVCSHKYTEKLKLLYILHLSPLLSKAEIEQVRRPKSKAKEDAEEAIEAEDFFGYNSHICSFHT